MSATSVSTNRVRSLSLLERSGDEDSELAALNAVHVEYAWLADALSTAGLADFDARLDGIAGDDPKLYGALVTRLTALEQWIVRHDPHCLSNQAALVAAAARFPLRACSGEIGFEPAGFQEMVLFIEDLPW